MFKRKYAPINSTDPKKNNGDQKNKDSTDTIDQLEQIDANGFERPEKTLFSKDKLNMKWSTIRPVGAGLTGDDMNRLSALHAVLQTLTYTPVFTNYLLARYHGNNCMYLLLLEREKRKDKLIERGSELTTLLLSLLGIMQDYCFVCALEEHISQCFKYSSGSVNPRYFIGQLKRKFEIFLDKLMTKLLIYS